MRRPPRWTVQGALLHDAFRWSGPSRAQRSTRDQPASRGCVSFCTRIFVRPSLVVSLDEREPAQDPPVIFDLLLDLGESSPLDASSTVYADALVTIEAFLVEHLASVIPVPCQMHPTADCERNVLSTGCVGLNDATLGICLDPDSKATLPHWPNCTSTPEYYGTAACRDANKTCIARCMPQGER